jgi:signal transduction histidine kinase
VLVLTQCGQALDTFSIHAILNEIRSHFQHGREAVTDRTRSAEFTALTAIAAQVNCTQDLAEILSGALATTLEVIGEKSGEIFLLNEESGELYLHTYQGVSDAFVAEESAIPQQECVCGEALRTRKAIVTDELATHPSQSRGACLREGFRACVRLPLLARGEVLGLLNIQSPERRQFTPADEELLTAIGHQIGIAIANAQLIEDAERRRATLDSVMRSLVDGLILVDRRGRIAYLNPRVEVILDLPADTLIGQGLDGLQQILAGRFADGNQLFSELGAAAVHAREIPVVEIGLVKPASKILQARFFPIHDDGGHHLGLGLVLRDITREKELDQMKSQLLATVSHELRTPLASIKGFATTLLRDDVNWDDRSRREFLSIIDEESDRLSELIGNLLDMSQIEAGTLRMEPEPTDLQPIIQETATEFQLMTHDHEIAVQVPRSLPLVQVDARRARQVVRNLVENAVKYSPDGGLITISAEPHAEAVQISVADHGIGIEPQQLEHVFDRFYQVDNASTRKVGGSGLGLSICRAIIEAHEGLIWAVSQPGSGSTFHFTLPLATGQVA